jgi:hypothetical protein
MSGKMTTGEAISKQLLNFANSMSVIDVGGFGANDRFSIAPLLPAVVKPIAEVMENRSYMGYTITKEPFDKEQEKLLANAHLGKNNVSPAAKFFTDILFRWGGGDSQYKYYMSKSGVEKKVPWILDINPSWIEHIFQGYTGGTGKVVTDIISTISEAVNKNKEIDFRNIPLVDQWIRQTPEAKWNVIKEFYDNKPDADVNKTLESNYEKQAEAGKGTDKYKQVAGSAYYQQLQNTYDMYDKMIGDSKKIETYDPIEGSKEVLDLMTQCNDKIRALKIKYNK